MQDITKHSWRHFLVYGFLILVLIGLIWRLVDLNIIDRNFLLTQSKARVLREVEIPAYRGMIVDQLGFPLAISIPTESVWINPQIFKATSVQINEMAKILNIPSQLIYQRARKVPGREFIYIKRLNPTTVAARVMALKIAGVFLQREYKRYYPENGMAAHVVGLTNVSDQGQEGLELAYNQWLSGEPGEKEVLIDRLGQVVANVALLRRPIQGRNLVLSIDHRIQYIAYRALKAAVKKYQAHAGSVVVLDPKTGEILAMVNQPTYNPNLRPADTDGRYRNRAVTDAFEPGSIVKAFTIALALESGKYTPDTIIDTNPGWMNIGGYLIQDDNVDLGKINLTEVLQKSSNIGAAKIMLSLQPQEYFDLLRHLGFGSRTRSGFPGESPGILVPRSTWYPSVVAAMAYGYGISVTTLQLAQAYAILADGGIKIPVTFLERKTIPKGVRVIPQAIAEEVMHMLESVVETGVQGTGGRAAIPGYLIAGKTGTSYVAGPHGYHKHEYNSSFVGIAPVTDPQLVVAVTIREPKNHHFGGTVAAPVFAKVMGGALRILDIPPDNLSADEAQTGVVPLTVTPSNNSEINP